MSDSESDQQLDIVIRAEEPDDGDHVRTINEVAFEGPVEARLVDVLRGTPGTISLVATAGDSVVGHIFFTRVTIEGDRTGPAAAGLGPMAVQPRLQRRGVGSHLVRAGLHACRDSGYKIVVVVGHPGFYPRFGFVPAHTKGLRYDGPVPEDAFMVVELRPGALEGRAGVVRYHPEFAAV